VCWVGSLLLCWDLGAGGVKLFLLLNSKSLTSGPHWLRRIRTQGLKTNVIGVPKTIDGGLAGLCGCLAPPKVLSLHAAVEC